ncbi:unnamed protein product [Notodromas monacha]|uniref:Uncharacterized protein n=1 Tax=Notodromas monacha TaxID=399045 RepID=A0A7R9GE33_9CRUS|nr:unnamed protein product [Notodromas monacha]CAG0919343.1 unnamed protein product [Notodromas monacha]
MLTQEITVTGHLHASQKEQGGTARTKVSIEEGLAETVQFFKEELDRSKDPRDHAYYPLESEQVKDSFHRADEL